MVAMAERRTGSRTEEATANSVPQSWTALAHEVLRLDLAAGAYGLSEREEGKRERAIAAPAVALASLILEVGT